MANNMSTLACEALTARPDDLRLSAPYTAGKLGMRCTNLTLDGKHLSLKLAGDMDSLTIPFEPSVFTGNGDEARKNLVLNVPENVMQTIAAIEDSCRQQLGEYVPNIEAIWCSSIKPSDKFGSSLRAKINVAGERVCYFYEASDAPTSAPETWKQLKCNAVVRVRGTYCQKTSVGLLLDITHLQYANAEPEGPDIFPF